MSDPTTLHGQPSKIGQHAGARCQPGPTAVGPRRDAGPARRGTARAGPAGGVGRADRLRRRPLRSRARGGLGGSVLPPGGVGIRRARLGRPSGGPPASRGDLRQGTVAGDRRTCHRGRYRRGRRRHPRPLGAALPPGQPRLRTPQRPCAARFRDRPVRPRAIGRRTHPRHGEHRGRTVPRAGVLGIQRGGRRTAQALDPRAGRPTRAPGLDRAVGHLRCATGQTRRRARRRAS